MTTLKITLDQSGHLFMLTEDLKADTPLSDLSFQDIIQDYGASTFVDALNESLIKKEFDLDFAKQAVQVFNDETLEEAVNFVITQHPELIGVK
jgi:hypothetical protein